jgi:hypothetical protein
VHDGAWLEEQEFAELRYPVSGLLPEGFALLVGAPKAGKSLLVLDWQLAVAAGGYALGRLAVPKPQRVLYLALEDGHRRMRERCHRVLADGVKIPSLFQYQLQLHPGTLVDTIAEFLDAHPDTGLVVVDTLGKVLPPTAPGESAYSRDYRVGSALKGLADEHPGLAVVALHHDRKARADDFVDTVSATHGLAGSADTIIVLSRQRGAPSAVLKVTGRDVAEGEYALKLAESGVGWVLDGQTLAEAASRAAQVAVEAQTAPLGELMREILAFVREQQGAHGDSGVPASAIAKHFPEVNVSVYLTRLIDSGRLDRLARGRYRVPSVPTVPSDEEPLVSDPPADTPKGNSLFPRVPSDDDPPDPGPSW